MNLKVAPQNPSFTSAQALRGNQAMAANKPVAPAKAKAQAPAFKGSTPAHAAKKLNKMA